MARKSKLNLATAKVADGALRAHKSVYDICGIATTSYKHKDLASYSSMLGSMNLMDLQDHAFKVGVLAGPDRTTLIDRLERKFLQENAKFIPTFEQPEAQKNGDAATRAEAERIISRGR